MFFSRHMSLPKGLLGVFHLNLRKAMTWQRVDRVEDAVSPFPPEAPQTQIVPELPPLLSEAVSDKIAMSSFGGDLPQRGPARPWDELLRDLRDRHRDRDRADGAPRCRSRPNPVVIEDARGAGDEEAGRRSLETLRFVGDAIFTDAETIGVLLREGAAST